MTAINRIPFGDRPLKLERLQRRLAWPLRKDDTHKSPYAVVTHSCDRRPPGDAILCHSYAKRGATFVVGKEVALEEGQDSPMWTLTLEGTQGVPRNGGHK